MSRRLRALSVIESLKLGVVPDDALEDLSVGCDDLLRLVDDDLAAATSAAPGGAFRVFEGGYGAGKSHLLDLAEQRALRGGFLVARVAFGSREAAPDRPADVYRALIAALRYPSGRERGPGRLLREAGASPEVFRRWTGRQALDGPIVEQGFANHLWLSPAILGHRLLTQTRLDEGRERLLTWFGGQPAPPPALRRLLGVAASRIGIARGFGLAPQIRGIPRWRSVSQIPCYILGGIGCLARDLGYAGLVLLLDEGEHFQWLTRRSIGYAISLARGFRAAALADVPTEDLPRGGRKNHRLVPYRFRAHQHLACFVALAPQAEAGEALSALAAGSRRSSIPPLGAVQLVELASRVLDLAIQADLDSVHLQAYRDLLLRHIDVEASAGRPFPPRRVVKLAAQLPDLVRAMGETDVDLETFFGYHRAAFG
ncbi:MAG: BREX system ATP-binding domain-containing protein [Pseudomonadota bacterium]